VINRTSRSTGTGHYPLWKRRGFWSWFPTQDFVSNWSVYLIIDTHKKPKSIRRFGLSLSFFLIISETIPLFLFLYTWYSSSASLPGLVRHNHVPLRKIVLSEIFLKQPHLSKYFECSVQWSWLHISIDHKPFLRPRILLPFASNFKFYTQGQLILERTVYQRLISMILKICSLVKGWRTTTSSNLFKNQGWMLFFKGRLDCGINHVIHIDLISALLAKPIPAPKSFRSRNSEYSKSLNDDRISKVNFSYLVQSVSTHHLNTWSRIF